MTEKNEIEIRPATQQDAKMIIDIVQQAFVQYCHVIGIRTIEALCETEQQVLTDMQEKQVYVACKNDLLIGSIRVSIEKDRAFISRFSILPEFQSQGIGRKLLVFIEQILISNGVKKAELYSAVENIRLKDFYLSNGFHIVSIDDSKGYQRGLFRKEYQ